jgi:hypothetical protein
MGNAQNERPMFDAQVEGYNQQKKGRKLELINATGSDVVLAVYKTYGGDRVTTTVRTSPRLFIAADDLGKHELYYKGLGILERLRPGVKQFLYWSYLPEVKPGESKPSLIIGAIELRLLLKAKPVNNQLVVRWASHYWPTVREYYMRKKSGLIRDLVRKGIDENLLPNNLETVPDRVSLQVNQDRKKYRNIWLASPNGPAKLRVISSTKQLYVPALVPRHAFLSRYTLYGIAKQEDAKKSVESKTAPPTPTAAGSEGGTRAKPPHPPTRFRQGGRAAKANTKMGRSLPIRPDRRRAGRTSHRSKEPDGSSKTAMPRKPQPARVRRSKEQAAFPPLLPRPPLLQAGCAWRSGGAAGMRPFPVYAPHVPHVAMYGRPPVWMQPRIAGVCDDRERDAGATLGISHCFSTRLTRANWARKVRGIAHDYRTDTCVMNGELGGAPTPPSVAGAGDGKPGAAMLIVEKLEGIANEIASLSI